MPDSPTIRVDVRSFATFNSIDTCAIWNILSSRRLASAARAQNCWFVLAEYVRYEAVVRRRTSPTDAELSMRAELLSSIERERSFTIQSVTVSDLQEIAHLDATRRLGLGEIAAMALAHKMRVSFLSDDQQARRQAEQIGIRPVQTTPHLVGWLFYQGELSDSDFATVVREHEASVPVNRGRLTRFFEIMYNEACRCRLMLSSSDMTHKQ